MDFEVRHVDGTTVKLISSEHKCAITSATQTRKLCGNDTVTINLQSATYIDFYVGDKITIFGTTYTLNQLPTVKKESERSYSYTLVFEGLQYTLIDRVFLMPDNTQGDNLMFDLAGMLDVLDDNINRGNSGKQYVFELDESLEETEYKNLSLTGKNCLQVLQQLCQEWDTEFVFAEEPTRIAIYIGVAGSTFAFPFTYGRGGGVYELNREKGASDICTRLFVYGGTQNLTYYRHNRLCLPTKEKNQSYVEDATAQAVYGIKEQVKNFDDIYPNRIGTITSLSGCDYNEFIDSAMADSQFGFDLNEKWANNADDCEEWLALKGLENTEANRTIYYNDVAGTATKYLMAGATAKIHFNTGALAGYECDLHSYTHSSQKFVLKPLVDENGYDFPSKTNAAFKLAVGDEYVILDINLPTAYKEQAESKLATEAASYFETVCRPQPKYTLTIEPIALKHIVGPSTADTEIFKVGDLINISDPTGGVESATIRIDQFVRNLLDPFDYKLTLTDEITYSQQVRTLIEVDAIKRVVEESKIYDVNRIRRGWKDAEELYNQMFDTEGHYYSEKIAPLSIDTQMLKVGARSQQLVLQNVLFQPNYNANPANLQISAGSLVHYTIAEPDIKTWTMSAYSGSNVPSTAQYVYAKCAKNGTTGTWLVTDQAIIFDSDPSYYHFLVGSLSSVDSVSNTRNFAATYGFTTINGRNITTGVIKSADGSGVIIDLDNNTITGNIKFLSGGQAVDAETFINDTVDTAVDSMAIGAKNIASRANVGYITNAYTESDYVYTQSAGNGAGLKFASTLFTVGGKYVLTFKIKKVSGTMTYIGGHSSGFTTDSFYVDGVKSTQTFAQGQALPDDTNIHTIEVHFIYNGGASDNNLYIQPNRGGYNTNSNVFQLWDIMLVQGTVATDWTPAPEDTEAEISQVSDETLRLNLTGSVSSRNTSGSTRTYIISCSQWKSGFYAVGTRIKVSVGTYSNSGYKAMLRIGSTDKAVKWMGSTNNYPEWATNDSVTFEYDGTYWFITDEAERITNAVYKAAQAGVTSVNGGLILTKVVQVGDGANQAGMSGLANSIVAFWAGGTIGNAQNLNTPVVIFKDGNAKFGLLNISKSGKLYFQNSGVERFVIQNDAVNFSDSNKVYNPSNINNTGATDNILTPNISGSAAIAITGTASNPDVFNVVDIQALNNATAFTYYPNMPIHIEFSASLYCNSVPTGSEVTCGFALEIYDGTDWNYLDDSEVVETFDDAGQYQVSDLRIYYEYNAASIPSTTGYKSAIGLRVIAWKSGGTASFKYTELTWTYYKDISKTKTIIGNNGFGVMRNSTNMFKTVIDENEEYLTTTIKGKTDIPGVLWAGKVANGGGKTMYFKNSAKFATDLSVSRSGSAYTITHNLGTNNYAVQITPYSTVSFSISKASNGNSFTVTMSSQADFDLTIFGSN